MQPDQATFLLNFLLPQIWNESKTTRKILEAVPVSQSDYRPDPNARTALDLAWHLARTDVWFLDGVANGEFAPENDALPANIKNSADVVRWYDQHLSASIERVSQLKPEQLTKQVNFFGIFNQPAITYLSIMINHSVHHRGQLAVYIRPMGGRVPSIYGGSFDEPFQVPQEAARA